MPIPVSTISAAVGRRSDQGTGDGPDCTANDRISHVVTASCCSERSPANTPYHSAFFRVGAARQSGGDCERESKFPHNVLLVRYRAILGGWKGGKHPHASSELSASYESPDETGQQNQDETS
ncbi:hypothetical protein MesoLj131a_23240 [Mesorhizobium sp. 131-2-1]|nr:hypothetical protein MesoLj131a_23240 [Mesorhizobium sp. 131-2-1]